MALIVVGVNHRTAPVETRERIALSAADTLPAIDRLRAETGAQEAVVLSTCNRTEFYVVEDGAHAAAAAISLLSERLGADAAGICYVRSDREAASHLFRVAAGMDSMILGEAQIHGQVRDAWELSRARSGAVLNRLFQTALLVGSRVRTETAIARGAASVSSAAVQLGKKIFGALQGRRAMVLGAGEMAELALECLVGEGVRAAIVANRTWERAQELAKRHGATAMHYEQCWAELSRVDLLLCSTSAPHAIVTVDHVRPAIAARGDDPLCILDIALPRDVDAAVGTLDNVFLYDLDDLQSVVSANLEKRKQELPTAEELIRGETERFWQWVAGLAAVPVVTQVRAEMERMRERELAQALKRLGDLTPEQRSVVEQLSKQLLNKFLHEPSVRLRAAAGNGRGLAVVDAARYLFALEQGMKQSLDEAQSESPGSTSPTAAEGGGPHSEEH